MAARRIVLFVVLVVGAVIGVVAAVASFEVNRVTSTDAFCTSCHSMKFVAADPHFINSAHHVNAIGVRPTCGDCHIPATNWFEETYTHAAKGLHDVIATWTNDFSDPAKWAARRLELAHFVREEMRRQDSKTCRTCHDEAAINPTSERGKAAHALLRDSKMTCIDCHFNLVHAPVPPSMSFIRGSALGQKTK